MEGKLIEFPHIPNAPFLWDSGMLLRLLAHILDEQKVLTHNRIQPDLREGFHESRIFVRRLHLDGAFVPLKRILLEHLQLHDVRFHGYLLCLKKCTIIHFRKVFTKNCSEVEVGIANCNADP